MPLISPLMPVPYNKCNNVIRYTNAVNLDLALINQLVRCQSANVDAHSNTMPEILPMSGYHAQFGSFMPDSFSML